MAMRDDEPVYRSSRRIRVLLVDDHAMVSESLIRLLGDVGDIEVVGTAVTGSEGIKLAQHEQPDVVLMDFALPDMTGANAIRAILEEDPAIKVITLTGSDRRGAYVAAQNAGSSAWVRKTRAVNDLVAAIRDVMAGRSVPTEEERRLVPLDQIVVRYQPIVDLDRRSVVAFEALAHWDHPDEGLIAPQGFLPFAEDAGYIPEIDRRVAALSLRDLVERWSTASVRPWVAINTSASGLGRPDLPTFLVDTIHEAGARPEDLVVEITETILLDDTPEIRDNLSHLKDAGVRLALDDFGTAFSSLAYLRRFPFDFVKIDTTFTAQLPHDPRAVLLVESIQQLATTMGALPIAEGIENESQAACLRESGWRLGQGFLYSGPQPSDGATRLLSRPVT